MLNLYLSLDDLKQALRITKADTARDTELLEFLESASREVDGFCKRVFYTETASRFFGTGLRSDELLIDDLLSISALTTDSDDDGTYDGETWVEGTDFYVAPTNSWPKTIINTTGFGEFSFPRRKRRHVKIVGIWNFGNGDSATPWKSVGQTITVADASTVTLTSSADPTTGDFPIGSTLLIATEQAGIVTATSTGPNVVTVDARGVNGTVAAAHDTEAASVALYPPDVSKSVRQMAIADENTRKTVGFASSEADGQGFATQILIKPQIIKKRALMPFVRMVI